MSLDQIRQELGALLLSPIFTPMLELIDKPDLPSPVQSVSVGAKFEAELIVGVSFSIDVATSLADLLQALQDPKGATVPLVTFLSVSLDAGIEGGAFTGVEFGIWGNSPDDLGGFSYGVEVTIVDAGGASVQVFSGTSTDS